MLTNDRPLKGLTNIGPTIAARFSEVGIATVGDLRRVGVVKAFQMVRLNNPDKHIPVCYYLYSLQGALQGVHWDALPEQTKRKLTREAGVAVRAQRRSRPSTARSTV
jgi:DNA transformation protein